MRTKYKHTFDECYFENRWRLKRYQRTGDWLVVGIDLRWFSPNEYAWRISLFGLQWTFWFKRDIIL